MKAFFSLLLVFAFFNAAAQNSFAPIGAEWHYFGTYHSGMGHGADLHTLYRMKVSGDTSINGTSCRKIEQTAIAKTVEFLAGHVLTDQDTTALRELYVYDNTDTVFIYNENFGRFTPLYVFNVQEGDTVCIPVVPDVHDQSNLLFNPISGDTSFCFVIDSIRNVTYGTTILRTFYNHFLTENGSYFSDEIPIYNWSGYYWEDAMKGAYAETIGGVKGGLLPVKSDTWVEKPTQAIVQNWEISFRCYSDSTYSIKTIEGLCDSLPPDPLSISNLASSDFNIVVYPNPSNGFISITAPVTLPDMYLRITDLSGRVLKALSLPGNKRTITCDWTDLNTGIYLLIVDINGYPFYQKITIND